MISRDRAIVILRGIIKDYFPELRSVRIWVSVRKDGDSYLYVRWLIIGWRLSIKQETLGFSESALRGLLAHELAHLVNDRISFSGFKEFILRGKISESDMERRADMLVVERGLGTDLLQFHKEHNREYKPYRANEGLTTGEIRKLLKG